MKRVLMGLVVVAACHFDSGNPAGGGGGGDDMPAPDAATGGDVDAAVDAPPAFDPTAGVAAACGFVHASEPGDGCTARVSGATVTVEVTNRTTTVLLGLIGINSFHASATASAAPVIGVRTNE